LVNQILTFSRQTEQEMRPVEIKFIVKEALKLLTASLPATIQIRETVKSDGKIMGDPTQIHQVLMNLCTNGAHAMEEQGGTLRVALEDIRIERNFAEKIINMTPGDYLHLKVSDTGGGIPACDLERIFEPFYTTKPEGKGTGLGLSLVHGIVKNHKGHITVDSRPGEGTCFDIYWPVLEDEEAIENETDDENLPTGSERILIVDDEETIIKVFCRTLAAQGYKAEGVSHPEQAIELFSRDTEAWDLVITDMTMPVITGDVLAKSLLEMKPDLPIIACTGFSNKINSKMAALIGIKGILMKPVLRNQLLITVREVLDQNA
ncbi:MAG: ATP-binding protein, partial [Desulfobacterales bacterium]|nr:ATP-binding protein [Desulfobacterales bacterium]